MSLHVSLARKILALSVKCCKLTLRTIKTSKPLESAYALSHSPNSKLNKNIVDRFLCLPMPECSCIVEYIWIDGTGENIRSKARTLDYIPENYKEVPTWSFDGNSTYQNIAKDNDGQLMPIAMYNDPFRRGNNKLILCEAYEFDGQPFPSNYRKCCVDAMNKVCEHELMWGIEQQFQIMDMDGRPYGWPVILGEPLACNDYYCGIGANKSFCREIMEAHYRACLYAGVQLAGINSDRNPGQWEYRVGICKDIKGADDLWMGRYILGRISEEYGVNISYNPQILANWHGSACHVSMSTKATRADNGLTALESLIQKLSRRHDEHMKRYDPRKGEDNKRRLTGKFGTSLMDQFTNGVSDRSLSVRISKETAVKKKGYMEDRRPASNCDPYAVCDIIVRTCLLDEC